MSAAAASSSAAASQSTVFVTCGNPNTQVGYQQGAGSPGSISPSAVLGKTITRLTVRVSLNTTLSLTHGGTPLAQSFFRSMKLQKADGSLVSLDTNSGVTFTEDSSGQSIWEWNSGTAWAVGDIGQVRQAQFFR